MSEADKTQAVSETVEIKSFDVADALTNLKHEMRAKIVSEALKKSAIGAAVGITLSLTIFKSNWNPQVTTGHFIFGD